ncbi:hypothetical protein TNCV_1478941 [Trichonephila clavipes]|nr:hypothetical protein TNCV_1478941 [Trichonephila clavipes]
MNPQPFMCQLGGKLPTRTTQPTSRISTLTSTSADLLKTRERTSRSLLNDAKIGLVSVGLDCKVPPSWSSNIRLAAKDLFIRLAFKITTKSDVRLVPLYICDKCPALYMSVGVNLLASTIQPTSSITTLTSTSAD